MRRNYGSVGQSNPFWLYINRRNHWQGYLGCLRPKLGGISQEEFEYHDHSITNLNQL